MTMFKDVVEVAKSIKSIESRLGRSTFTLFFKELPDFGLKEDEMSCPLCDGDRRIFSSSCPVCHGTGVIKKKDHVFS